MTLFLTILTILFLKQRYSYFRWVQIFAYQILDLVFPNFFCLLSCFFNSICQLSTHISLESARQTIQEIAHKAYSKCKSSWFPFFKKEDFEILRNLSKNRNIIVCKPDKGKGTVLMNRTDYVNKMKTVLSDQSKFQEVGLPS